MKLRLEFTDRRGSHFPWALRLCKKFATFKQTVEDGMNVYSVEFDAKKDAAAIEALAGYLGYWKQAAWYCDGQLTSLQTIVRTFYNGQNQKWRLKHDPLSFIRNL
jgi:hypothetical protein